MIYNHRKSIFYKSEGSVFNGSFSWGFLYSTEEMQPNILYLMWSDRKNYTINGPKDTNSTQDGGLRVPPPLAYFAPRFVGIYPQTSLNNFLISSLLSGPHRDDRISKLLNVGTPSVIMISVLTSVSSMSLFYCFYRRTNPVFTHFLIDFTSIVSISISFILYFSYIWFV